jgi:hypothetical protein
MLRLVHPRMGQFARFAAGVSRHDAIAPVLGTRTLASYLDALAALPPPADAAPAPASAA